MANFLLVLFLGWSGAHKFVQGKVGMGLLYLFTGGLFGIGWLIDIISALGNISKPKPRVSNARVPAKKISLFEIRGMYYRTDNVKSIMQKNNPNYSKFVYRIKQDYVQLVPELQNPHDSDAIKIMMNGVHIGYVPAEITRDVKPLIGKRDFVATIKGGDEFRSYGIEEFSFNGFVEVI